MEHEKKLIQFQLHIDMYPVSKPEQKLCETLYAHIAAINTMNEAEAGKKYVNLQDLIPFIEKILHKVTQESFLAQIIDNHLHISRQDIPSQFTPDLAIISYLNII